MSVVLTFEQLFSYRTQDRMQTCWHRLNETKEANFSSWWFDFFRWRGQQLFTPRKSPPPIYTIVSDDATGYCRDG